MCMIHYALSSFKRLASWNMIFECSVNFAKLSFILIIKESFIFAFSNSIFVILSCFSNSNLALYNSIFSRNLSRSNSILSLCTNKNCLHLYPSSTVFSPPIVSSSELPYIFKRHSHLLHIFLGCLVTVISNRNHRWFPCLTVIELETIQERAKLCV